MTSVDELDIVIRRRGGRIVAGIPQIKLYAKAANAELALAALEEKKKIFMAEIEEMGGIDELNLDASMAPTVRTSTGSGGLGQFAVKTIIVVCAVTVGIVFSSLYVSSNLNATIDNAKSIKIGGKQFWSRLESELDRLASPSNDLPAAKKEKLLADIRTLGARWHPFVVALQSGLAGADNPATMPTTNK